MANEFGTLNLEEMAGEDARLKSAGGSAGFINQFVPMPDAKPGQTVSVTIRILPPMKGAKLFQYNRVHTLNNRKSHCPRPLVNGKWDRNVQCPICDMYSSIWRRLDKIKKEKGDKSPEFIELKKEADLYKPVERYYYNAIVRSLVVDGKEEKNVGPRILSVGKILHKIIVKAIMGEKDDPDSKLGNITDLKAGWDFVIRKENDGGYPKYERSAFSRQQSPAGTAEEIKKWAESLHDLTKLRNPRDVEHLEKELAIMRGLIPDDAETFDVEGFDAKWRGRAEEEMDEEMMDSVPQRVTRVTVPDEVPTAPAASQAAPETKPAAKSETLAIEDEDFLKELEGMDGHK